MNKLQLRKLILSCGCVILLVIAILQGILKSKSSVKTIKLTKAIDEIVITNSEGVVTLKKQDTNWVVGEQSYPVTQSNIDEIIEKLSSICAIEKTGSASSEEALAKYELNEGKVITVVVKGEGKELRTLKVGKNSVTGAQTYISFDSSSDVYLCNGDYNILFNKNVNDFRSRIVAEFDTDKISSISINVPDGESWSLSKIVKDADVSWIISGADIEVDEQKAQNWFNSFKSLSVKSWYDEYENLDGIEICSSTVTVDGKQVSFEFYKIPAKTEGGQDDYYGKCSLTPYRFAIAQYNLSRFQTTPESLKK